MQDQDFERSVRERLETLRALVHRQRREGNDPLLDFPPADQQGGPPAEPLALAVLDRMDTDIHGRKQELAWALAARLIRNTLRMRTTRDAELIPGTRVTREGLARLVSYAEPRVYESGGQSANWATWVMTVLTRPPGNGEGVIDGINVAQLQWLEKTLDDMPGDHAPGGLLQLIATGAAPGGPGQAPRPQAGAVAKRMDTMQKRIDNIESMLQQLTDELERVPEGSAAPVDDEPPGSGGSTDDADGASGRS